MEMELEAVMAPHKQVFKGIQKRQRNQISPLSSRNLQSPFRHAVYMIWYDIFVNCNWFVTRWQPYSTHLHTHTHTIHRTIQNKQYKEQHINFGSNNTTSAPTPFPPHSSVHQHKCSCVYWSLICTASCFLCLVYPNPLFPYGFNCARDGFAISRIFKESDPFERRRFGVFNVSLCSCNIHLLKHKLSLHNNCI